MEYLPILHEVIFPILYALSNAIQAYNLTNTTTSPKLFISPSTSPSTFLSQPLDLQGNPGLKALVSVSNSQSNLQQLATILSQLHEQILLSILVNQGAFFAFLFVLVVLFTVMLWWTEQHEVEKWEMMEVEMEAHMRRAGFEDYLDTDTEERDCVAVKLGKRKWEDGGVDCEEKKEEDDSRLRCFVRKEGLVLGSEDGDGDGEWRVQDME